ncbi:hypothetical protein Tco_1027809, partial [Tanacetum coccineum]
LPQDVLMQVAQYSTAKEVWDSIKVKYLRADLVQKARLQTLRSELETLRMKPNEKVSDYGGKLSSIIAKFKGLGETLEDKVLVRKLLNSVPKKFLPIVATIEQYQDLDIMSFEEAVGRLTAFEERIKSQDKLEANDQDRLLMASSNNRSQVKKTRLPSITLGGECWTNNVINAKLGLEMEAHIVNFDMYVPRMGAAA